MKLMCPITGCNTICYSKEEMTNHFRDKHPEVETLNFGGEKVKVKEE